MRQPQRARQNPRRVAPYRLPPFMRSFDAAWRWVKKNVSIDLPDRRDPNYEMEAEHYQDAVANYLDMAERVVRAGSAEVYRAIDIPAASSWRDSVNLQCLGKAWSARRSGAGVYGMSPHARGSARVILLVGVVEAKHVDWAYGLTSFMYYGEDQWEVSLLHHAPVLLREIDGEVLAAPIMGSTGTAGETWVGSCQEWSLVR